MIEWKIIQDFEDYKISNYGQVYSFKRKIYLKPLKNKGGYLGVYLYKNKKRKYVFLHRLVAINFIPNPNNYPQINHKDENSENNCVENLEWCTCEYNANYGTHKDKIRKRMLENNPFKNKKHTKETLQKMSIARKGKPNPKRKRAVKINGIIYDGVEDAMEKLNICTRKFYNMLKEEGNGYV